VLSHCKPNHIKISNRDSFLLPRVPNVGSSLGTPFLRSKLLGFCLSRLKSSTSPFLIDNFERLLALIAPQHARAKADGTSILESLTSGSNRHIPELESLVSHRKQRIGPRSNRHKFAFFIFPARASQAAFQVRPAGAGACPSKRFARGDAEIRGQCAELRAGQRTREG
jgi:hypothetical protein